MKQETFQRTPLARGVTLALGATGAGFAAPAVAQDDAVMEEIVVTGIRGSLMQSADVKRNSRGITEAITAEDIGKFPDTNLAESLQRITGVSIDRERGEGQKVTVRGFGPQYNLVTLNGRQMPTHGGGSGRQENRSFDFADLAAEAVSAVEVYKTSNATLPTGGIGSTINIKTTKPLEATDRTLSFGVKAVNDTSTETGSSWTPEISGIYVDQFADDTFGVALTAIYQERDTGVEIARGRGWNPLAGDAQCCDWSGASGPAVWSAIPNDANQANRTTSADQLYSVNQQVLYTREEYSRTRMNGQLTLQWDPTDTIRGTFDYTHAQQELDRTFQDLGAWFLFSGNAGISSEWDTSGGPLAEPISYTEVYGVGAGADIPMGSGIDSTKNTVTSAGLNVIWDVTDRLSLGLDYHSSNAKSEPNSDLGSAMSLSITSPQGRQAVSAFYDNDLPIAQITTASGGPLTPDDMLIGGSTFTNRLNDMDIEQATISGEFTFSDLGGISFGIQTTDVDNRFADTTVQRDTWGGVGAPGDISDLLSPASMAGWFDEIGGGSDDRRFTQLFTWDTNALIQRARDLAAQGVVVSNPSTVPGDCGDGFCPSTNYAIGNFVTDKRTQEESIAVYAQLELDLMLGDMPANLDIGIRYEETDVASQAQVPLYDRVDWITSNEFSAVPVQNPDGTAQRSFTSLTGEYDYVLPNVDFNIEFIEDVLFRASYSETIGRPNFQAIQGGLTITECRAAFCAANSGDPALLPLESQNIDLSFEWYYGEGSYAAAGYFRKDVTNFIGNVFLSGTADELFGEFPDSGLEELTNPSRGGLAEIARANGAVTDDEVRNYIFANFPNEPNVDPVGMIIAGTADNELVNFDYTVPVNNQDAEIDGWELAWQHTLGDTGFGWIVNATIVDGDIAYDNLSTTSQFALTGLSDSANFIGFFDKYGVEVRLAYNWRDEFLSGIGHDSFGAQPRYVEEYGQWDLNASYTFGYDLQWQVFLEAINITDETSREHARAVNDILTAAQVGARYALGFRAKF